MTEHNFTKVIIDILQKEFGEYSHKIFENSELIKYLNEKTVSANKGSKSRGSFANLYALYVLIEDYLAKGYPKKKDYNKYEGAVFSNLMKRQRELPFGNALQNHALNSRMNEEFKKYFPSCEYTPIIRDLSTKRYWINEKLLMIKAIRKNFNIAKVIIDIIDKYVKAKEESFNSFIENCQQIKSLSSVSQNEAIEFIISLVNPEIDARIFEIVSYAILKQKYSEQIIYWGYSETSLNKEFLKLYKTGRTNANDGGIDFVMKPIGRFFQVTETLDFRKYFLDIDKIERYPITFVIKSNDPIDQIKAKIRENALKSYSIEVVVDKYMKCIEEIINIPYLKDILSHISKSSVNKVVDEIIHQSRLEFNQ